MTVKTLAILFATVALPLTAQAQGTATMPADTQPPAAAAPRDGTAAGTAGGAVTAPSATMDPALDSRSATTADAGLGAEGPFVTVPNTGAWRVADLQGKAVYGADGENIGEINDVLVNAQGEVAAVIIGVGGFLGLGEKDVAVAMNALEFGPGDGIAAADAGYGAATGVEGTGVTGSTTTDGMVAPGARDPLASGGATMTPGAGQVGTTVDPDRRLTTAQNDVPVVGNDGLPDRIILSVTREQLEDAPEFEGVRAAR